MRARILLIGTALLTTSCGDSSGSGSTPPIVSAPAPTPTPAPSPTPTPTPVAYALASDFTRDRSATAIGFELVNTGGTTRTTGPSPETSAIGFDFAVATRTYQARYNTASITAPTTATTGTGSVPSDQFSGATSSLSRAPLVVGTDAASGQIGTMYSGLVVWRDTLGVSNATVRFLLFGARTLASDLPTAGQTVLTGQSTLTSTFAYGGSGASTTLTIDYAARSITGTTGFYPASLGGTGSSTRPPPALRPITLAGTLDAATGRLSGTATFTDTGEAGRFEGALYGPRGTEGSLLVTITGTDGTLYYGVIATRN